VLLGYYGLTGSPYPHYQSSSSSLSHYGGGGGLSLRQQQIMMLSSSHFTHPDPTIADTGNAVVAILPDGQTTVLMVVQETPPITATNHTTTSSSSARQQREYRTGGGDDVNDDDTIDDTWTGSSSIWPYDPNFSRRLQWEDWVTVPPRPCRNDPTVYGYGSYQELKTVLRDVNRYSAERHDRWNEYSNRRKTTQTVWRTNGGSSSSSSNGGSSSNSNIYPDFYNHHNAEDDNDDDASNVNPAASSSRPSPSLYYQEEITITICPRTTLYGFFGPLFINTESLTIQCDDCTVSSWGSHFSFGPSARNVKLAGLAFRHATASSMVFPYGGADVSFEHCKWINNSATRANQGSVLDMHSASVVHFYRSYVSQPRPGWRRGHQTAALSIRQ
jgi:hypothetical protein